MYESFYKLNADAFRISPDKNFRFEHAGYAKARAYLTYAFQRNEGFVVITGRPGTGKTTLINDLLDSFPPGKVCAANLVIAQLISDDLLKAIAYQFKLEVADASSADLLQNLTDFFTQLRGEGRRAIIIVDEAHALPVSALEELRLLTNLHERDQPLVQIFLIGQPELHHKLRLPELEQAHQQIVAACNLEPLGLHELKAYIFSRLKAVGWAGNPTFDPAVFPLIQRHSEGVPRRINSICGRLMLKGSVEQLDKIRISHVQEVMEELRTEGIFITPDTAADDTTTSAAHGSEVARDQDTTNRPPATESESESLQLTTPDTSGEALDHVSHQNTFPANDKFSKLVEASSDAEPSLGLETAELAERPNQTETALEQGNAAPDDTPSKVHSELSIEKPASGPVLPSAVLSEEHTADATAENVTGETAADLLARASKIARNDLESDPDAVAELESEREDDTETSREIDNSVTSASAPKPAHDELSQTAEPAPSIGSKSVKRELQDTLNQTIEERLAPAPEITSRRAISDKYQALAERRPSKLPRYGMPAAVIGLVLAAVFAFTVFGPELMPDRDSSIAADAKLRAGARIEDTANERALPLAASDIAGNEEFDSEFLPAQETLDYGPTEKFKEAVASDTADAEAAYFEKLVELSERGRQPENEPTSSRTAPEKPGNNLDTAKIDSLKKAEATQSKKDVSTARARLEALALALKKSSAQPTIKPADSDTAPEREIGTVREADSQSVSGLNVTDELSNAETTSAAPAQEKIEKEARNEVVPDLAGPANSPKIASTTTTQVTPPIEPPAAPAASANPESSVARLYSEEPSPKTAVAPILENPVTIEPSKDLQTDIAPDDLASLTSTQNEESLDSPAVMLEDNLEDQNFSADAALKERLMRTNLFVNTLVNKVNRKIRYPRRAAQRGQEGKLELVVTLNLEGRLLDTRVVESSGHRLLDKAAVTAAEKALDKVAKASINASVIEEFGGPNAEQLTVPVPITFRMN